MRASRRRAACRADGVMCYPLSRNGNMPAGPARPRRTRGGRRSPLRMRIITTLSTRPQMSVNTRPTLGAFLICTEMFGMDSGLVRGIQFGSPDRSHRPASGSDRVIRGGSWDVGRVPAFGQPRQPPPEHRYTIIGFRVGFKQVQPDRASPELVLSGGVESHMWRARPGRSPVWLPMMYGMEI